MERKTPLGVHLDIVRSHLECPVVAHQRFLESIEFLQGVAPI
jgi:hypothetical protein